MSEPRGRLVWALETFVARKHPLSRGDGGRDQASLRDAEAGGLCLSVG